MRLTNGISLNLSARPNVDFGVLRAITVVNNRAAARDQLETTQGYYNEVKSQLHDTIYNDNLLLSYKRSRVRSEGEINEVFARSLAHLQRVRLEKYKKVKSRMPAFALDLTRPDQHTYPNPFDKVCAGDEEELPDEVASAGTAREVRELCEPEGGLGTKTRDFELRFKL